LFWSSWILIWTYFWRRSLWHSGSAKQPVGRLPAGTTYGASGDQSHDVAAVLMSQLIVTGFGVEGYPDSKMRSHFRPRLVKISREDRISSIDPVPRPNRPRICVTMSQLPRDGREGSSAGHYASPQGHINGIRNEHRRLARGPLIASSREADPLAGRGDGRTGGGRKKNRSPYVI